MEELDYEHYLYDVVGRVVPDQDLYGVTTITVEQWTAIREKAAKMGGPTLAADLEADGWVQDAFRDYGVFTILEM